MATTDHGVTSPGRARIDVRTLREDRWWLSPLTTFVVFSAFVVYATVRAFMGRDYYASPYLSPFYSPCLGDCVEGASDFGQPFELVAAVRGADHPDLPAGLPDDLLLLPQGLLPGVLAEPRPRAASPSRTASYSGETRFPLILQNVHRYFWYAAVLVGLVLTFDVFLAFRPMPAEYAVGDGETSGIHMGLGTLLMIANVAFIWLYTLSCHSCRHVVGGRLRHFSKHPVRYRLVDLGLEAQRAATAGGRGTRCSRSRSSTSTSSCSPRARSRT